MIRVVLFRNNKKAYGFDVTGWENKPSDYYDNLLTEDLIERVGEGDILMFFDFNEDAEEWLEDKGFEYELVEPEEDDNK